MKLYSKFLFAIFFVFNLAYSQTETISINWKDVNLVNDQEGRFIIHGFSQEFLSYNPASKELRYERSWKLSQNSYKITNLVYQPISKNKIQHINLVQLELHLKQYLVLLILFLRPPICTNFMLKMTVFIEFLVLF